MEVGEIQNVTTIVACLGAAVSALLCDYLKKKNDQLVEALAQLRSQHEQETLGSKRAAALVRRSAVPPLSKDLDHKNSNDALRGWLSRRAAAVSSNQLLIPGGMFDNAFLARLLEIDKPFTGLVVSIGVNENDASVPASEELMRGIADYIAGLLRPTDFGCRNAGEEFLIICPGEQGAEAHRRLSYISERLWDFQLRGIGTLSFLFSWDGVEVRREPLMDAIHSASGRMRQTKRSRKAVSMDTLEQRRKAV